LTKHDVYDWKEARAKVVREKECRNCHKSARFHKLEAAHTIGRDVQDVWETVQEYEWEYGMTKPPEKVVRSVPAVAIIPLCEDCHRKQHAAKLDILPLLDHEEQANAVKAVGITRAVRKLSGGKAKVIDRPEGGVA
jgi:hypothetical protein